MQEKNDTNVSFCQRFTDLLHNCELTQKQLATQLDLSEGAIINYKRDRIPKADELYRIAKFFGVSMEWLLYGEEIVIREDSAHWREQCKIAEAKLAIAREALKGVLKKIQ